jgi:C-terminal processing protease CtpA/Prc
MGLGKFVAGALIGALAVAVYDQTNPDSPSPLTVNSIWGTPSLAPGTDPHGPLAALSRQLDVTVELTHQLEAQLEDLSLRLNHLEQTQQQLISSNQNQADEQSTPVVISVAPAETAQKRPAKKTGTLTMEALVDAGIDPTQAEYILRRQGELDLQRLDLRDRAIREGNLGSKQYVDALRELNQNTPKLRDEVGDDVYDRYLYAMGQHNRVVVTSVIPGSAADQAGIREGDMILDYGADRVFTWPELRKATTEGYRGEYITLNVQRGQQILSMLVPRGPLGVRMKSSSKPPLDNPEY